MSVCLRSHWTHAPPRRTPTMSSAGFSAVCAGPAAGCAGARLHYLWRSRLVVSDLSCEWEAAGLPIAVALRVLMQEARSAGIGGGARVAAAVAGKCRGVMSGYALLSYPLQVSLPGCWPFPVDDVNAFAAAS